MAFELPRRRKPEPTAAPVVEPVAPAAPKVDDIVQTRWGWYGQVRIITDKGYGLLQLYVTQDGVFIRPGYAPRRWVWFSEVVS